MLFPPRPAAPAGPPPAGGPRSTVAGGRPTTMPPIPPRPAGAGAGPMIPPRTPGSVTPPPRPAVPAPPLPSAPSVPPRPTPRPTTPAPGGAGGGTPTPARAPINPFLANDPNAKARRLARALVSDLVVYFPQKRDEGLRDGTLKQLFKEEIQKSYEEYEAQVGREFAESTTHFRDALNEILASGQQVF